MSNTDIHVTLSRLALAKAIKTPDVGEEEAEPWTKSIIFHQPHIDAGMRNSILNPQSNQQRGRNSRGRGGRQQQQPQQRYPSAQQQYYNNSRNNTAAVSASPMNRVRSEERYQKPQLQQQQSQQQPMKLNNVNRPSSTSSGSNNAASIASTDKKANNNTSKSSRKFIPSDDEQSEEDDDEKEEEEEDDESDDELETTSNHKVISKPIVTANIAASKPAPTIAVAPIESTPIKKDKGKQPNRTIQPSDDEEDSEEEDEEDDEEEDGEEQEKVVEEEEMYARRMSTLRQLERGTSTTHRRTRSTGDMVPTVEQHQPVDNLGPIDQWRMTVMEAEDMSSNSIGTPPSSSESFTAPLTEEEEEDSDNLIEEPIVKAPVAPLGAGNQPRQRRSTMGEMDMFYFQQQAQAQAQQMAAYNIQMQQAMQLQQAQQFAQIQQYQQMQQQQLYQQQQQQKQNNRKSAMDLMLQLEQEKASQRKQKKKQMPDPSKANLHDGLLGKVPGQGQFNLNFQQHVLQQQQQMRKQQQMSRASKSDYNMQSHGQRRPSSNMMIYNTDNRRSQMIRSESSPIPTISMSTPLNQYNNMIPPQQQQQQLMTPPPQMTPSRSSQYISKPNNHSHRQSTFSGYNF